MGANPEKAFKYEMKASALAISSGAFSDGFMFAELAFEFIQTQPELDTFLQVIQYAIQLLEDLQSPGLVSQISTSYYSFMFHREASMRISRSFHFDTNDGIDEKELEEFQKIEEAAAKPYTESRIATEQSTLQDFQQLKLKATTKSNQLLTVIMEEDEEEGSGRHHQDQKDDIAVTLNSPKQSTTRDSLLSTSRSSAKMRQLSWQPSFFESNNKPTTPTSSTLRMSLQNVQSKDLSIMNMTMTNSRTTTATMSPSPNHYTVVSTLDGNRSNNNNNNNLHCTNTSPTSNSSQSQCIKCQCILT
jgi:hypothetical protein